MATNVVSIEQLCQFSTQVFVRANVPEADAKQAALILAAADLRGIDSHGVARLSRYYDMLVSKEINPTPTPKIVRESASTATVDGDNGLGLVVAPWANRIAIEKAKHAGSGWVAVSNSNHFGIAGYYPLQSIQHDVVGWATTNGTADVTPLWGAERMLGTNPIAIAFPGLVEPPIVIDMATSVVTIGSLENAIRKKTKIPVGWGNDRFGNPSTDPEEVLMHGTMNALGGVRELGGHRGYCMSAMVDILSSLLGGANFGPFVPSFGLPRTHREPPVGKGVGHFFGGLSIEAFTDVTQFKKSVDLWIQTFRKTKPQQGKDGPLIPGDPEREQEARRSKHGIPLMDAVFEDLRALSRRTHIPFPECIVG